MSGTAPLGAAPTIHPDQRTDAVGSITDDHVLSVAPTPIERDRFGRPLIIPPGGGRKIPYTRCTTYVGVLEDTYNLSRWQQRMVAIGLAERPDLLLAVASVDRDDKDSLNDLCERATEAARARAGATVGTALHALTERVDRGQELGVIPDPYTADIAAYTQATADLTPVQIEQFTVNDWLGVGGTPDRIVKHKNRRYVADIKTGNVEYGIGKIAMQLATYARSQCYDPVNGARTPHDADLERALIIHLPAGTGVCTPLWVDIAASWEGVKHAKWVREWRSRKLADFTESFVTVDPLAHAVAVADSVDVLNQLWAKHKNQWTAELHEAALTRKQQLTTNPPTTHRQPAGG
jgi:hypothetical protein